jgi:hypothetical protein
MAAIADGFQYEGGVLWGDIDFINSPGVFSLRLRIVHADDRREELDFKLPVVSVKMNVERGRGKLVKIRPTAHIDGTAALLDAMCVRQKHWAEIGEQLTNRGD